MNHQQCAGQFTEKTVDLLTEDRTTVSNQSVVLLSYVSAAAVQKFGDQPNLEEFFERYHIDNAGKEWLLEMVDKYIRLGVKIRGCFPDTESGKDRMLKHIEAIKKEEMDDYGSVMFDTVGAEMYKWLCLPYDRDAVEGQVYQEEKLNKMVSEYCDHRKKASTQFDNRTNALKSKEMTLDEVEGFLGKSETQQQQTTIDALRNTMDNGAFLGHDSIKKIPSNISPAEKKGGARRRTRKKKKKVKPTKDDSPQQESEHTEEQHSEEQETDETDPKDDIKSLED